MPSEPSFPAPGGSDQAAIGRRSIARGVPRAEILSLAVLALLVVAGGFLRRYHLGYQSLWFDEADIVQRASHNLGSLLPTLFRPGENGPLYTLFLHYWIGIFGAGEVSVRFPSFLLGTLSIPALYALGRKLGGPLLGLIAAFLLTISPYHIWYSQESKMYAMVMLLTILSVTIFLYALDSNSKWLWAAYVVTTTLGLYVHLAAVLILAAEIIAGIVIWRRANLSRRSMAISFAALVLPYLPLALWETQVVASGSGVSDWYPSVGLVEIVQVILTKFSINRVSAPWEIIATTTLVLLAIAGLLPSRSDKSPDREFGTRQQWLLIYMAVPILLLYAINLRVPIFHDRYLLVILPAYYLLAGSGLAFLRGKLVPVMAAGVILCSFVSYQALVEINYASTPQKEDWRGIVQYVQQRARLKDVVFVLPGYMRTAFEYYYVQSNLPQYGALAAAPSVRDEDFDYRNMDKGLSEIVHGHDRVWLVVSPERAPMDDPDGKIREWFDGNLHLFDVQSFNGAKVYRYSCNGPFQVWSPPPTHSNEIKFGDQLRLFGFDLDMPSGKAEVEQGKFLFVTLYWQALQKMQTEHTISVQVVGQDGKVVSQRDIGPLDGYYPTNKWTRGESVRDYHDLYIRYDVPPGTYRVQVAVYPPGEPGTRLAAQGSGIADNAALLSTITVLPAGE